MKKILNLILLITGANLFARYLNARKLGLIGYHAVSDLSKDNLSKDLYPHLALDRKIFELQIAYLCNKNYRFINFSDLLEIKKGRKQAPRRGVLIYFDDGFRDVYLYAYPILKKFGARAVIFLTSDFIDQKEADASVRSNAIKKNVELNFESSPIYLNWAEADKMKDVFEFGVHGISHRKFTELTNEELNLEMAYSIKKIKENLSIVPLALSYPKGRFNKDIDDLARKSGFEFRVTTQYGFNDYSKLDFPLRKISINPEDDLLSFKAKLGMYYPLRSFFVKT